MPYETTVEHLRGTFQEYGNVNDAIVLFDRETGRSKGFGFVTYDEPASAVAAVAAMNGNQFMGRSIRVNISHPREVGAPAIGGGVGAGYAAGGGAGYGSAFGGGGYGVGGYAPQGFDHGASAGYPSYPPTAYNASAFGGGGYMASGNSGYSPAVGGYGGGAARGIDNYTPTGEETKLYVGNLNFQTTGDELREAFAQYGPLKDVVVLTERETGRSRGFGFVEFESCEAAKSAMTNMDGHEIAGRNIRVNVSKPQDRR